MIYVVNNSNNAYFNHATEEYLLTNFQDEIFMLWINKPSILIGRNQNTLSEINSDYVKSNNIDVVRRLSGGGAVFNDLGNMNFTFITNRFNSNIATKDGFERFALPVIKALDSLNVQAEFTGRNDITIDGKKFSGNAQYFSKDKLLHHGTLMYNCDVDSLSKALKCKPLKFKDKGIKSISSRVTNISSHMNSTMDLYEFKDYLMNFVMKCNDIITVYELTNQDIIEIEKIMKSRFETWEWNYGKSPNYSYQHSSKYSCGSIEYHINVNNGIISNISLYGDFFGEKNISELESKILGINHNLTDLSEALKDVVMDQYVKGLSTFEFLDGLINI
ncbi:lipoate-protein ligase [Clostridium putrefaciens]|uniref:lipoate--protein ligase n=1 Tax=Clostridium putrefaciens TaxID=99675 RepID=A0A381J4Q2_9CLOT|nr:lipoate--protein ligase [Clostridium putrefaciens]SUY46071.1 lipoate-protein ligase [Clostridium putrefaciens]